MITDRRRQARSDEKEREQHQFGTGHAAVVDVERSADQGHPVKENEKDESDPANPALRQRVLVERGIDAHRRPRWKDRVQALQRKRLEQYHMGVIAIGPSGRWSSHSHLLGPSRSRPNVHAKCVPCRHRCVCSAQRSVTRETARRSDMPKGEDRDRNPGVPEEIRTAARLGNRPRDRCSACSRTGAHSRTGSHRRGHQMRSDPLR